MRTPFSLAAAGLLTTCAAICATSGACSPSSSPAAGTVMYIGVQSDDMGGLLGLVDIAVTVDGQALPPDTLTPPHGDTQGFPAPWTKTLTAPAGNENAAIHVEVKAYAGTSPQSAEILTRTADTHFVPGGTKLLRLHLEQRCLVFPASRTDAGSADAGPPAALSGPVCSVGGQSCVDGRCQSDTVAGDQLENWDPNWAVDAPDICKPANAGPPLLYIGTGQTDFLPITDGETLQAELGPQGGHHVWIAVRMHNLKQSGSTTKISAVQPGTNVTIPPSAFVFTFDPDEGGYCKLYGLRYQLDNGGIDYTQFLGKSLDITATVTDATGATASAVAHVNIAPTILMP